MKLFLSKTILVFILIQFIGLALYASDYNADKKQLKGKVVDKETMEPLIGATVYVVELNIGTATDLNGSFTLRLPDGKFNLKISYIGYMTGTAVVEINENVLQVFYLERDSKAIEDVLVSAKRADENLTRSTMSVEKMKIQDIRKIPALMGEVDIIKAIQLLPGVQATSEGSSGFSVRGGNMDQNLIIIDEAPVYNASHLLGFFSVFNNDAIEEVELYKGDMPVAYGGRLSSLLDVKVAEGSSDGWHATGGVGLISSRLTVGGPLLSENTTLLLAGRRTYVDIFFPLSKNEEVRNSTLYFYDLNGKIRHRFNDKNVLLINAYIGNDEFGSTGMEFGFGNKNASASWLHTYNEYISSKTTFFYSQYGYKTSASFDEASSVVWKSKIRDYGLRFDNTVIINENNTVKFGFSSTYHHFYPGVITPASDQSIYNEFEMAENAAIEWGIYGSNTQKLGNKLTLKYGIRFSIFQNIGPGTIYNYDDEYAVTDSTIYTKGDIYNLYQGLEPRLGVVYQLNSKSSIKASYARTRQYIHMASNSTGGTPLDIWIASNPNIKPQIADQVAVGYFRNFFNNLLEGSGELYYKKMNNTIDFKDHAQLYLNPYIDGELRFGESKAYGSEFQLKFNTQRFNGWVSYTLSKVIRDIPEINKGKQYVAPYDKPHTIAAVFNYEPNSRWVLSANWIYSTGNPMTIPAGSMIIDNVQLSVYTDRNSYRMPDYHRLDIGVTYKGKDKPDRRWKDEWNVSLYNAYARHNAWAINFRTDEETGEVFAEKTYLFSIVPSITYNFKF